MPLRGRPRAGLAFGLGLAALAFAVFWFQVNPLSAWLALGGLLFYVFVYTVWLKRSSPQNIVIGGAAGAFPPLVGWAAVTGGLDLAAVYLFAIIFYWTPPHFWALAIDRRDAFEAERFQHLAGNLPHRLFIVDHEHSSLASPVRSLRGTNRYVFCFAFSLRKEQGESRSLSRSG